MCKNGGQIHATISINYINIYYINIYSSTIYTIHLDILILYFIYLIFDEPRTYIILSTNTVFYYSIIIL